MRNKPLKGLMRKPGAPSNPSISDSSRRGNVIRPVIIQKEKKEKKNFGPKTTKEGGSGYLIDTNKRNVNRAIQGNPLARLFSGIKPKSS
jgi:hypothetical protein